MTVFFYHGNKPNGHSSRVLVQIHYESSGQLIIFNYMRFRPSFLCHTNMIRVVEFKMPSILIAFLFQVHT